MVGTRNYVYEPSFPQVREMLKKSFKNILDVNHKFPRVEKIMFPEFLNDDLYLLEVLEDEEDISAIIDK